MPALVAPAERFRTEPLEALIVELPEELRAGVELELIDEDAVWYYD